MADVSAIRTALKAQLQTISGLRCYDVMPPAPELPGAAVALRSIEYGLDMDDNTRLTFDVWLYVNSSDLQRAQRALDAYLANSGAQSVRAALEASPSLGGIADWVRVTGAQTGPTLIDAYGSKPLALALQCEVVA